MAKVETTIKDALNKEMQHMVDENPDLFTNRAHFIRAAIIQKVRAEKERGKLKL